MERTHVCKCITIHLCWPHHALVNSAFKCNQKFIEHEKMHCEPIVPRRAHALNTLLLRSTNDRRSQRKKMLKETKNTHTCTPTIFTTIIAQQDTSGPRGCRGKTKATNSPSILIVMNFESMINNGTYYMTIFFMAFVATKSIAWLPAHLLECLKSHLASR